MKPSLNKLIVKSPNYKLNINVSGLNTDDTIEIGNFSLQVYAHNKKLIFSEKLDIEQARDLYNFLSQFSIIKDRSKMKTGAIVEITDNKREIIEKLLYTDEKDEVIKQIFEQTNDKTKIIQQLIDDSENIEKIVNLGGKEFFKKIVAFSIFTKETDNLIETLHEIFTKIQGNEREILLLSLQKGNLTKDDLDILSGRKNGLKAFHYNLFNKSDWTEKKWQTFFENNTWIFGYGLDYKFLTILQRESHVSDTDIDGKNGVIADFLLGNSKFTVLVELKRPDTKLFENDKNRSESWQLSNDLTNAVSQILTQKAEWVIKSQTEQFNENGNPIKQRTIDPKAILIIGQTKQFSGDNKEQKIKAKTFELYRRNMRNIEIITYDELYEKATFIVNQK